MRVVDEDIRRMVLDEGMTDAELAEFLGVKVASAARRRVRAGLHRGRSGVDTGRAAAGKLAMAERFLDDGCSVREAALSAGLSWETVDRHFPGRKWSRCQVVEHATATSVAARKFAA